MVSLLDETDNLRDWQLQSILLIHFIFIMNFKLLFIKKSKWSKYKKHESTRRINKISSWIF